MFNIDIQSEEYASCSKMAISSWEQLKNRDFVETRFCRVALVTVY